MLDVPYEEQLHIKHKSIQEAFKQNGLPYDRIKHVLGMKEPWFYRNKVSFPIRRQNNRILMGYFKKRTHDVVSIEECYTQNPYLTEAGRICKELFEHEEISAYDEKSHTGLLRHYIGRVGHFTGEIMIGLVVNGRGLPSVYKLAEDIRKRQRKLIRQVKGNKEYPLGEQKIHIVSIMQNINTQKGNTILADKSLPVFGPPFFQERLDKFVFKIRLNSFFQINSPQAIRLYNQVRKAAALTGSEFVVDAYAGVGPIALWLSEGASEVVGIEAVRMSVKDATDNAVLNDVKNVKFEHLHAAEGLKKFKKADVVILDPPRGGLTSDVKSRLARNRHKRIIYVSCNPLTLAHDLKELADHGYSIERTQPVDLFPHTEHIETVVTLNRNLD